jgi:D-alanyl-D-alanine carboxypeptidase/D-alanyl-D-alanine-endopeptidase (penicillin-binding protein 4)
MIAAAIVAALLVAGCTTAPQAVLAAAAPAPAAAGQRRNTTQHRNSVNELHRDINRLLAPTSERTTWGVLVKSLTTNDTLYALNPRKLFLPASNMKLAILAAAAEQLGWAYSYETRIFGLGTLLQSGFLDGDLLVVGSGDPSIDDWDGAATRLFQSWAEQLKTSGVGTIGGRIIGDDNTFDEETLGMGWAWDDLGRSFATGVGALQFNENTARLTIVPAAVVGQPPLVGVAAPGAPIALSNQLTTAPATAVPAIEVRRLLGSPIVELRGSVPLRSPPVFRNVSVDNPTQYFVNQLRDALEENGIDVFGAAVDIDALADPPRRGEGTLLLTSRSPSLSTLAATMMKLSQNLYAETLLKTLGGFQQPATAEAGRLVVQSTLASWGIDPADLHVVDGSGLSPYDLATPTALVAILTRGVRDVRLRGPFEDAMPIAGRDGTLAGRLKGTAAEGNARAKTGSLSNSRAISGYVYSADGEPLVFSILANNFGRSADAVETAGDAIVVRLAEFSRTAPRR